MTNKTKPSIDEPIPPGMQVTELAPNGASEVIPAERNSIEVRRRTSVIAVMVRLPKAVVSGPRRLSGAFLFFILTVILPTIAASYYFFAIASSQYVVETRFGVRFADLMKNDASAIFEGMPSASQIGLASTAITQYLQSREIVDALQSRIDLRAMYSNPSIDPLSRLGSKATIEQLVDYWKSKVDPFFDLTTGAISVRVKAFTPQDAQRISASIITLSEALVNDMSLRSREQTIKLNKDEVASAEKRLQKARDDMEAYRNRKSVIDASKEAESRMSLVTKLREQLIDVRTEMTRQRDYLNENAPTVKDLAAQTAALQNQLTLAEAQLTSQNAGPSGGPLSTSIGGFEALTAETMFAQKYYDSMMEALLTAEQDASRQLSYLAVFVHPAMPESALYPRRAEDVLLVFLTSGGLWMLLLLGFRALREHVI